MGAVTALLYSEKNQKNVSAVIADSPFSNIKMLVRDFGSEKRIFKYFLFFLSFFLD